MSGVPQRKRRVERISPEVTGFDDLDEAIIHALSELEPGGRLDIHGAECQSEDGEANCTCVPKTYYKGATA